MIQVYPCKIECLLFLLLLVLGNVKTVLAICYRCKINYKPPPYHAANTIASAPNSQGAGVLIYTKDSKKNIRVLLAVRALDGQISIPAGTSNQGESVFQTAMKKLFIETGGTMGYYNNTHGNIRLHIFDLAGSYHSYLKHSSGAVIHTFFLEVYPFDPNLINRRVSQKANSPLKNFRWYPIENLRNSIRNYKLSGTSQKKALPTLSYQNKTYKIASNLLSMLTEDRGYKILMGLY